MSNPSGITCHREGGKVVIAVSEDNLVFGIENHPENAVRISDRETFLNRFIHKLPEFQERGAGFNDQPDICTLFDRLANDMAESGEPSIEIMAEGHEPPHPTTPHD